ncbi:efflux RND transporter periplasmic adaptor subunit [bacterium]|nr:MAG: efflux RND transporter periplasmic adaptor subunit [bacterium]
MTTINRTRSSTRVRSAVTFALLGLGAVATPLLLSGCGAEAAHAAEAAQAATPAGPPVSVAEVVQQEVHDSKEFTGRVEAVERVELRPRVAGYIESVRFREGAEVKKGDVLFVIDPRPYAATLKRAQAELARAKSGQRQALSERERATKLLQLRAFSQEEFDARTSGSEKADADVQAAQAAVDAAELDLTFTQVRAPIAGVVGKAEITAGNFVASGTTLLARLVSIDPVYVRFEGDEAAYLKQAQYARSQAKGKAAPSQPVAIGLANEDGYPHQGELVFTDNELNSATGTIAARAKLDNPDRLFTPGLFARVLLGEGASYAAVLVKDGAIGTDQNRRYVYVVKADNTVEYRTVELGPLVDGLRVVKSGLVAGETVVVNGLQRVRPGAAITPERIAMRLPGDRKVMFADNQAGKAQ